ncbi:unnamed protein product [Trichobilharzia regenti]|nr:unnamed protein product [Trichobilharzia regenti]
MICNRSKGGKNKVDGTCEKLPLGPDLITNEQSSVSYRPHIIYDSSIEQLRITEERIQEVCFSCPFLIIIVFMLCL